MRLLALRHQVHPSSAVRAPPDLADSLTADASQPLPVPDAPDIAPDALDEPPARLAALRADPHTTYLAYLPHSGLHNQRIALENALVLAKLLNRTLLVPPARLGHKTLRYVRSSSLARFLALSDKRASAHCAHVPPGVRPDECVDWGAYTLVPWTWLVDFGPAAVVRVSNGTPAWIQTHLGPRSSDILLLPDASPYEHQFVDTPAPPADKYLGTIQIDDLVAAPHRLVQLGTLFGSSRLRLRKPENRRARHAVRRGMVFTNAALAGAVDAIRGSLGTYVGVHVRVGDGRFQREAHATVRAVWWELVRDVLGTDVETAWALATGGEDEPPAPAARPRSHPPLDPLPETFSPKRACRGRLYAQPSLARLNVPLFVATDAPGGLDDPLLAPLTRVFPCVFSLGSFKAETAHLDGLRNGYDGVRLGEYLAPIVDALVLGGAWAVVGTEGSTFSRYVEDVLWRTSHGWDIVERG